MDSQATSSEVHWQTILFVLLGIGLGAMFQPSGHVCGASSRYAPYLRSLPAVGVANALAFVLRPTLAMLLDKKNQDFRTAWKNAIKQRYDDPEVEVPEDMARSLLARVCKQLSL